MTFRWGLDFYPLLAATLAALTCGLLGNFLVLRRLSLMGDAISHSVLPGLVIAFLVAQSRDPLAMLVGAAAAGVATVVLVELVKRLARAEPGAAMGVVFSILFAIGVLLIERAAARDVDLDADCVLHGQLELLASLDAPNTLGPMPRQVAILLGALALAAAFVALFFKELRIAAFDPELATAQGVHAAVMHYMLMVLTAVATVASFEAVGSILVIAMLICPAAVARLLTDRLGSQITASLAVAAAAALLGYYLATAAPAALGFKSVNTAGAVTVVLGAFVAAAALLAPAHGVIPRTLRRRALTRRVETDDLLAALWRLEEAGDVPAPAAQLEFILGAPTLRHALPRARRARLLTRAGNMLSLTQPGRSRAAEIVRRHRLWESYLVHSAGVQPDHVHDAAERLEHIQVAPPAGPTKDPHGRTVPEP